MTPEVQRSHAEHGISLSHHFCDGVYIKQAEFPAGKVLEQHVHRFPHFGALGSGSVMVEVGGAQTRYDAPALIMIPANAPHRVLSLTPCTWWCIWRTDLEDVDAIDASVTA